MNSYRTRNLRPLWGLGAMVLALSSSAVACSGEPEGIRGLLPAPSDDGPGGGDDDNGGAALNLSQHEKTLLDSRIVSYTDALRTASMKLTDKLPALQDIKRVHGADDPKAEYEVLVDAMFASGAFRRRMIRWWKDTMRQGGGALNTAPTFAARVMVEGRPYGELFTASEGTCPSYDTDTDSFVDGSCDNGVATHAGVLTNPGSMKQFYANMAFRRVRWVQEIFACSRFPAEYSEEAVSMGAGQYTSPWEFESVGTEPIDFQDTSAVVCANCHTTLNHIAPLFANFDAEGMWKDGIQVLTPTAPDPTTTELSHWLRPGEKTAWRLGVEAQSLPELGQALAKDPDVQQCMVARMWNFTMSKEDIVSDLATVPVEVIAPYLEELAQNGGDLGKTLRKMFNSADFVRF